MVLELLWVVLFPLVVVLELLWVLLPTWGGGGATLCGAAAALGGASAVQGGAAPARSTVEAALGGAAPLVVVLVALGMICPLMMVGVWADSLFSPFQIKQKYNTICIDSTFHLEELQLTSEIC